jgi:fructose-1,6-bisphosphatase II
MFIATGLTSGAYVHHVKVRADADGRYMITDTVVLSGSVGNIRRVQTTLHI